MVKLIAKLFNEIKTRIKIARLESSFCSFCDNYTDPIYLVRDGGLLKKWLYRENISIKDAFILLNNHTLVIDVDLNSSNSECGDVLRTYIKEKQKEEIFRIWAKG